jgi:hypothetical protein
MTPSQSSQPSWCSDRFEAPERVGEGSYGAVMVDQGVKRPERIVAVFAPDF